MQRSYVPAAVLAVAVLSLSADPPSKLQFVEVARSAGIHAEMRCGGPAKRWIPEANGSGAAWLDYDNDGLMDLLIVNGQSMEQLRSIVAGDSPPHTEGGVYLFHNLGHGRFEDVTARAGLANDYWGTGANAADYNNDGFTDILITAIGADLLYKNNGNGTFTSVSKAAGLSRKVAWHTGSAFGDFDGDGNLDLYVSGYVDIHSLSFKEPAPVCSYQGVDGFCGPIGLKPEAGILYRNNGDGTFTDFTKQAGLGGVKASHSFTAVFDDFNRDGKIDLFVANDSDPNFLFLNKGDGTFQEAALESGVAVSGEGSVQANMGVAISPSGVGGRPDILTTTFDNDYFPLFRQDKSGNYEDTSTASGLTAITHRWLGWACGFADFLNSGRRQLWLANGHVYPRAANYFQPVAVLDRHADRFTPAFEYPAKPNQSYRGGVAADYDNDGRMDLLILPIAGQPVLLHNQSETTNSWLGLQLQGTRGNRDGIGAAVRASFCGVTAFDTVRNGGSYLSRNDPRLHFGLGDCRKVDRVVIRWPAGEEQELRDLPPNRYVSVREPSAPPKR